MKFATQVTFLAAMVAAIHACSVEITTKDNKKCVPFKPAAGAPLFKRCTTWGTPDKSWCATAVDANMLPTAKGDCKMQQTVTVTRAGKKCLGFQWKGVKYPEGQCAYADSTFELPWCPIKDVVDMNTDFVGKGSAGGATSNWDYCNVNCNINV